jgi:hypothetical protein
MRPVAVEPSLSVLDADDFTYRAVLAITKNIASAKPPRREAARSLAKASPRESGDSYSGPFAIWVG